MFSKLGQYLGLYESKSTSERHEYMQARMPKSSDVYDITNTMNLCALVPFSKQICEKWSIDTETPKLVYHTLKLIPNPNTLQDKSVPPFVLNLKSTLVDCVRTIVFYGNAPPTLRVTWVSPRGHVETYTSPFVTVSEGVYAWSRDAFMPQQSVLLLDETDCEINSSVEGVVVYEGILYPSFDREKRMETTFPFRQFEDKTSKFVLFDHTPMKDIASVSYTPNTTLFVKDGNVDSSLIFDRIAFCPSQTPFRMLFDGKIRLVVTKELVDAIRSKAMEPSGYYDQEFDICYLAVGISSTCNIKTINIEQM